jgi:hypothetical protein
MVRQDGLIITGPIAGNGRINEMRVERPDEQSPSLQLVKKNGRWRAGTFSGPRLPIDGLSDKQQQTFERQLHYLTNN